MNEIFQWNKKYPLGNLCLKEKEEMQPCGVKLTLLHHPCESCVVGIPRNYLRSDDKLILLQMAEQPAFSSCCWKSLCHAGYNQQEEEEQFQGFELGLAARMHNIAFPGGADLLVAPGCRRCRHPQCHGPQQGTSVGYPNNSEDELGALHGAMTGQLLQVQGALNGNNSQGQQRMPSSPY
ncbi:hypothetical protein Anapl_09769 [Anas platyrhynchos]|uniref:Uncharacterized protein n=1 Tax=Anas platyrhynchos TaxID=8839 RepID=R0LN65_ANAPL|nr:hypothetical protein Anapl_09769 [Anas platyrhynchos]